MILLALEFGGNKFAWNSATEIGLFIGGGICLILFILWEHRVGDGAMIPLKLIAKRQIWTSCLLGACLFASILGTSYYLSIYFQSVRQLTPFKAGVSMLPAIIGQLVFAVCCGALSKFILTHLTFLPSSNTIQSPK